MTKKDLETLEKKAYINMALAFLSGILVTLAIQALL